MNAGTRPTNIVGLTVEVSPTHLVVSSATPLRVVTTAPYGAEFSEVCTFLSVPAPDGLDCVRPESYLLDRATQFGLAGPFVGFLTAVHLTRAVVTMERDSALAVTVVATVGVANASRPGEQRIENREPGTINLIVVVDADLSPNALLETLAVTVEAKALAVYEAGAVAPSGLPATGTSTDAYAVACSGKGCYQRYAGPVTAPGYLVGKAVRRAVGEGLVTAMARLARTARP